jgi:hypothetical protein
MMPGDHSCAFLFLQNLDIDTVVSTFIRDNGNKPLVGSIVSLLDAIQAAKGELQRLVNELISTLIDRQFYVGLLTALKAHVEAHPWATTFFIIGVVIGVILMCNPLAIAGFGSLGPVAGKSMVLNLYSH